MTNDLLKLEMRLLLLRHGRKKVMQALAELGEQTLEQVENELKAAEERKPNKKPRIVTLYDAVASAVRERPEAAEFLQLLATRYNNRTFLPQLKDVQRFLDHSGTTHKKVRSRAAAGQHVIATLSRMSTEELRQLVTRSSPKGDSDYALLAREIIGKTAAKPDPMKDITADSPKIFKMTFTAIREGGSSDITGVQTAVERGEEKWSSRLLSPGEFAELMLASHIVSLTEADKLFRRVREEGPITEPNVAITQGQMHVLGLRHAG